MSFALSQTKGPHAPVNYGWNAAFLRWVEHQAGWLSPVVAVAETTIGVAGVNPVFMVIEGLLILAWRNAGWYGADRFLLKWLGVPGTLFGGQGPGPTATPVPAKEP